MNKLCKCSNKKGANQTRNVIVKILSLLAERFNGHILLANFAQLQAPTVYAVF
jgi:hypothetical protein